MPPRRAKKRGIDHFYAEPSTDAAFDGRRIEDRYTDDDFVGFAEIAFERLSLSQQRITKLPPLQPAIRQLSLGHMSLATLDGIEKLVGLQRLWLTELPKLDWERVCDQLAELPELTELTLGSQSLVTLPRGIAKLPSLVSLSFYECTKLDQKDAFEKLGKVATLRLLDIEVQPAPLADALSPLSQVTSLRVRAGGVAVPASVGDMTNLQRLQLEYTSYESLPTTIGRLKKLQELDVTRNDLTALPDEICACTSLEVLNLDDTLIKELPADLGRLVNLRVLNAYTKKLKTLPRSIKKLVNLRELRVPWKHFKAPVELFELTLEKFSGPSEIEDKLTLAPPPTPQDDRVWIHDADRIPDDFGDPIELEISLDGDITLPQLSKLRRLQELTIDVKDLDDAFRRLVDAPQLRALTIEGERETLPESLGLLVQLESLAIDSGSRTYPDEPGALRALPDAIGKLVHLKTLALKRTALKTLPAAIGQLRALAKLEIRLGAGKLPAEIAACTALADVEIQVDDDVSRQTLQRIGTLPALRSLGLFGGKPPLDDLFDALAGAPLEELYLYLRIKKLPRSIGKLTKLKRLGLARTDLDKLPGELKQCAALEWISVPSFDRDYRDRAKADLPEGRWKKNFRSHVTWYERTDA